MSKSPLEIKIEGIVNFSPLYIPLETENDLRVGHVEPTADKIGNDPNVDVTVFLSTWDLLGDLSQGAWHKDKVLGAPTYDEPMYTRATGSTLVQPLAWTLNRRKPLMPGCGLVEQNGAYAFGQFVRFKDGAGGNTVYALDVKSNKVYKNVSEVWTDTAAPGAGNVTELALFGKNDTNKRLYLGRSSGNAKYYDGSSWSDAGYAAQHFLQVGKAWYYADGNRLKKDSASSNALDIRIGVASYDIGSLLWFNTQILAGKPDALWVVDPTSKLAQDIITFPDQDANNCRFLVLHNGSAWFPAGEILYELTSGFDLIKHRPAIFDGYGERAEVGGKCLWAHSDANNLYVCYKVTTATTYDYFLIVYTGAAGGFHPVLAVSVLKANDPAYVTGGIYFDQNKLRYSFGNDKTGYLLTDGYVPMADAANGIYYTRNVGIWLGDFTAGRDHVSKLIKQLRVSMKDLGSTGQLRAYYKKWTDTNATTFPSDLTGTQENAAMTPTAEGGNVAGFTTTKVNIGLELRNSDSTPENAWWLKSAHLAGAVTYGRARLVTFNALLDYDNKTVNRATGRSYNARRIEQGILAGISQSAPVRVTLPDGSQIVGGLLPNPSGVVTIDSQKQTGKPRRAKMAITLREYA